MAAVQSVNILLQKHRLLIVSVHFVQKELKYPVCICGDWPPSNFPANRTLIAFPIGLNEGLDARIMKATRTHRVFRSVIESRLFFHQKLLGISHLLDLFHRYSSVVTAELVIVIAKTLREGQKPISQKSFLIVDGRPRPLAKEQ
jgi:hypothetical protein